jgi:hypothetical protein
MKKIIIVLAFLALVSPVFAQHSAVNRPDNLYYTNVSVERIFPSRQGYVVQYRSASSIVATVGIPNEWFTDAAGIAELVILPTASDWPTMTVFYKNGEFSHVRLYVHPAKSHLTWGNIPQGIDVSGLFTDKESFKIQY